MAHVILNTRPAADSQDLENQLSQRGHIVLAAPMLDIRFSKPATPLVLDGVQAVVFTSANGVRAFARHSDRRDLVAFCVGDATATLARTSGFDDIHSAGGDVDDLAALIVRHVDPARGSLFHPAARKVAGDLQGLLAQHGITVIRQIAYDALPAQQIPAPVHAALIGGGIDAVLFFSPRTAETFVKLIKDSKLDGKLNKTKAICLSPAVRDRLSSLSWGGLAIARHPTQNDLLVTLDDMFS